MDKGKYIKTLLKRGIVVTPLKKGTKHQVDNTEYTLTTAKDFWNTNPPEAYNFAIQASPTQIIIDIDDYDSKGKPNPEAQEFRKKFQKEIDSTYQETTQRGTHLFYKYSKKAKIHFKDKGGVELRANTLTTIYPSTGENIQYLPLAPDNLKLDFNNLPEFPAGMINYFETHKPDKKSKTSTPKSKPTTNTDIAKVKEALSYIDPDISETQWFRIACSLFHFGEENDLLNEAFDLFNEWSATGSKYDEPDKQGRSGEALCKFKWKNIAKSDRTDRDTANLGTLFHMAQEAGYQQSHEPSPEDIKKHLLTPKELQEIAPTTDIPLKNYISEVLPTSTFTDYPGITGRMVREMLERNPDIHPSFAFLTALAILSTIKAGKIELSFRSYTTPAAIYGICLADSGAGKDFFATTLSNVLARLNLTHQYISNITSGQGIHLRLQNISQDRPHCTGNLDEIHHLFKLMANRNSQSYTQTVMPYLLQLFSAHTKQHFGSDAKATAGKKNEERKPINNPTFTVLGFGTTDGLENLFTHENLSAGFVNRCLIFTEKPTTKEFSIASILAKGDSYSQPYKFEKELADLTNQISLNLLNLPENKWNTAANTEPEHTAVAPEELTSEMLFGDDQEPQQTTTTDDVETEEDVPPLTPLSLKWSEADNDTAQVLLDFLNTISKYRKITEDSPQIEKSRATLYARAEEQVNRLIAVTNPDLEVIDTETVKAACSVILGSLKALEGRLTEIDDDLMMDTQDAVMFKNKVVSYLIKNNVTYERTSTVAQKIWGGKQSIKFSAIAKSANDLGLITMWSEVNDKNQKVSYIGVGA